MKIRLLITVLSVSCFISSVFSKPIDIETARKVGLNFYFERINITQQISLKDLKITGSYTETNGPDNVYYIFNINSGGFIIISADDACYPVIGYSFEGNLDMKDLPGNFNCWMKQVRSQVIFAHENNLKSEKDAARLWQFYALAGESDLKVNKSKAVNPLTQSEWGQGTWFNMLCPLATGGPDGHAVVGCVATAMSQIMYYYRYPLHGSGAHGGINFGNTHYRWNEMRNLLNSYNYGVAELCYHAGVSVGMIYHPNGSAAFSFIVPNAMKTYFGYDTSINYAPKAHFNDSSWATLIRNNLDALHPLLYSASDSVYGGHAWVCDGYQDTNYFHMNWGWNGNSNGYFYTNSLVAGGYNFTVNQALVYNIFPGSGYPFYCSGDTTILPYTQGSIDDGSSFLNYANNTDCMWLIAPSDPVKKIYLDFLSFDTEPLNDTVTVYDGDSTSAPVLGTFSGSALPPGIVSSGNKLLVRFKTNDSITSSGWMAEFHCTYPVFCTSTTTLTADTGSFDDGSGPEKYAYNQTCQWKIQPVNATGIILSFSEFDLATDDYLKIIDDNTGHLLATLTGNTLPDTAVYGTGKLHFLFKTNSIYNAQGFVANYMGSSTGIHENTTAHPVYLFPNPTSEKTTLEIESPVTDPNTIISVYSIQGQLLEQLPLLHAKTEIDLGRLPSGVYIVKVCINDDVIVRRIIKE